MPAHCGCCAGSGRSFTAYVFNKAALPLALPVLPAAEAAAAHSIETPAQAAEAAPAGPSSVAWQAAEEAEGETAQSRLAEATRAASPAEAAGGAAGRGRRRRKPSAKQRAAAEAEQAMIFIQAPAGREPSSTRQEAAAERVPQNEELQAQRQGAQPPELAQQAQAAEHAAVPQLSPRPTGRSVSRPAAAISSAKPTAPLAVKLSSPQRAGVHKRSSPVKLTAGAAAGVPSAVRRSPRRPVSTGTAPAKGAAAEEPLPASGAAALLQGNVRVVKAGVPAAGKAVQAAPRRSARRGLLEGK